MKTRISQLVAALFFTFLVVGNGYATEHKTKASSHESNYEASLELENWMLDETIWSTSGSQLKIAQETRMEVENWMTNMYVWDVQVENLRLENWMVNENIWEVDHVVAYSETEQDLSIENWMVNENIWKI
ncbi:hypothetical protein OU798_00650 [Prolixibacteraceae bacterium Z1-6]|uniref:Uncharacterized protein n=1 Tax=Draconibacterium aestuarii TaxID=2998507 RepID=A0A9X3J2Y6_9BACT|nr:hypothetical protein [Prolixibacteraceae bacterium Z1-6]